MAVDLVIVGLFVAALVAIRHRRGDRQDERAEHRHLANGEQLHDVERATGIGRY